MRSTQPTPPPCRVGRVVRRDDQLSFVDPYLEVSPGIPLAGSAAEGDWVEVEVSGGEARLVAVRAAAGSAMADVYALAASCGVDPMLPPACEAEAAAWSQAPGIDDPTLEDLTHLAFATIDNPGSKDLDQALLVEADGDGHVVWYALADAAWFVRPGSALMTEALARGTTFYMPGLVAPMLPFRLCEDLVSLNPRVDRRALVFRMQVDATGRCRGTQVSRARVQSRAKLSYSGVQAWLDGGEEPCGDPEVLASLRALVEVGERRMAEAESRDVVRFRRQELAVSVAGRGLHFVADAEPRNDMERYNEQISLLANIEGARLLRDAAADARVQPVFRTHEPPREELLQGFADLLAGLIRVHGLPEAEWSWRPGGSESLASYVRRLPLGPGPHQGIAQAIQRQALLTGGRSGFSATPSGHHGVGAEVYSRFTAPMREVVGIFVHKELWELLGSTEARPREEDEATREQVLSVSQKARQVQRTLDQESNRLVLDQLFAEDLASGAAPERAATVMGLGRRKVHVRLDEPPIDLKVYAFDLEQATGRHLLVDAGAAAVLCEDGSPLFRVGETVQVRVAGLDEERDRWRLELLPASCDRTRT